MTPEQKANLKWNKTPKGKYSFIKRRAKRRGIEFFLSFEEWWKLWQESGHWEERGKKLGNYQMCRHGDEGPYSIGNVYIATISQNMKDSWKNGKIKPRVVPLSADPKINKRREAVRRCYRKQKEQYL